MTSDSGYKEYLIYLFILPLGIFVTHFYRLFVIRQKILEMKISWQIIFIILFSIIKAIVFFLFFLSLFALFGLIDSRPSYIFITEVISDFTVVFCLWNTLYFGFHYFQNYKFSEINALRYLAASRESELKSLKAQLNPHFIFNCMNSIRALIDEDPEKAKSAVTRLSNMLRNTLLLDKSKEIWLKDEIGLVQDYLNLEQIRYEERLSYEFRITPEAEHMLIPPFIIQAQVENAIKHGISKLPGRGAILIEAFREGEGLRIRVSNTGKINAQEPLTGVGFKNSAQRLELLYGTQGRISIEESGDWVIVEIGIPVK